MSKIRHPLDKRDRLINEEKKRVAKEQRHASDVWRKRAKEELKAQEAKDELRSAEDHHLQAERS